MATQVESFEVDACHLELLQFGEHYASGALGRQRGKLAQPYRSEDKVTSEVGYCVGWCCASLSSFNMCMRVVLPALSSPC